MQTAAEAGKPMSDVDDAATGATDRIIGRSVGRISVPATDRERELVELRVVVRAPPKSSHPLPDCRLERRSPFS